MCSGNVVKTSGGAPSIVHEGNMRHLHVTGPSKPHPQTKALLRQLTQQAAALQRLHTANGRLLLRRLAQIRQSVVLPQVEPVARQAHVAVDAATVQCRVQRRIAAAVQAAPMQMVRMRQRMLADMRMRRPAAVLTARAGGHHVAVVVVWTGGTGSCGRGGGVLQHRVRVVTGEAAGGRKCQEDSKSCVRVRVIWQVCSTYRLYSPGIFTGPASGTPPPTAGPVDAEPPRMLAAMRVAMLSVPLQPSEPPSGSHEPARMSTFRSLMFDVRSLSLAPVALFSWPRCC